jgi:hypothetical protein
MKGESKGDFTRDTFDPKKHFARVLMQQGRVQLDADSNEQTDILLHYIQTLAADIIGPFAGTDKGFAITKSDGESFDIGYGNYYVDGILVENEVNDNPCKGNNVVSLNYYKQLDYPINKEDLPLKDFPILVYLDVWERHISYVEDDDVREKALGGPDTTTRSKVVWQVKVLTKSNACNWFKYFDENEPSCDSIRNMNNWTYIIENCLQPLNRGCLSARAKKPVQNANDPCIISPESHYRGAENQLYRVEIHRGGIAWDKKTKGKTADVATFKWSRDNGSVVFPISSISGNDVILEHLGRDARSSLNEGDWVEVIDDDYTLLILSRPSPLPEPRPRPLARVKSLSLTERKVTLNLMKDFHLPDYDTIKDKHPILRRWDYRESDPAKSDEPTPADGGFSALFVEEGECKKDDNWLTLEDGVQICFQAGEPSHNKYQAGDYWLIPARTATGDVEWPGSLEDPMPLPPHGIGHHYAPLAVVSDDKGEPTGCRCIIKQTNDCP